MQDNPSYDESAAYSYQHDSYKYLPCDMDVISWLGAYFVKSEMYEKVLHVYVCVFVFVCVCVSKAFWYICIYAHVHTCAYMIY